MIKDIGPHRIRHGNVMEGIDDLMAGERAYVMYSDPPWGQGNLKYWATMNRKMNEGDIAYEPPPLEAFLRQIFAIAKRHVDGFLLLDYGIRWESEIREMGEEYGFDWRGLATPLYRSGSKLYPCHTHLFTPPASKIKIPKGYFETLDGLIDYAEVREAMRPFALEGQIVLDPCCGLGNSARIAVEHGMTFFGNELNAARLAKTEKILRRAVR